MSSHRSPAWGAMPIRAEFGGQRRRVGIVGAVTGRHQVDPGILGEGVRHGQDAPLRERIALQPAKGETAAPRRFGAPPQQILAIPDQLAVALTRPVPFQHREFRRVGAGALAVAVDMRQLPKARQPGHQQLLHGEFRAGVQVQPAAVVRVGAVQVGGEGLKMRLHPRRDLKRRGVDLDEGVLLEKAADGAQNPPARGQERATAGEFLGVPGGQRHRTDNHGERRENAGIRPSAPPNHKHGPSIRIGRSESPCAPLPMTGQTARFPAARIL